MAGSYCADDNFGYRFLAGTFCHVAGCAKIFPVSQLGTAYALIFFIQNIGLWGIPTLIGWVLDAYCISGKKPDGTNMYDYTVPMCIFTGIACLSLIVALLLKKADKKYGYKLEEPNIQK